MQERFHNKSQQMDEGLVQVHLQHKDGRLILIEGKGVPIVGKSGEVEHIVFFGHDISERKHAEKQLMESEERYRKLVEYSPETILIHQNGKIIYVNNAGLDLVGAQNKLQIIGKNVLEFVPPEYLNYTLDRMRRVENEEKTDIGEQEMIRLDGTRLFIDLLAFQTTYQGEKAVQVIMRDITKRKRAEEQVNYLAYYDFLTDLPNRNFLYDYLSHSLERSHENTQNIIIMFLDLDRFKMINDTFGHSFGDLLLKQVSSRLKEYLYEEVKLFRYGGDEFIIVLEHKDMNEISKLADKIIDIISSPLIINDKQIFITTSIGISIYPKDGENIEDLIKTADTAMYSAKGEGKNTYRFYNSSLDYINRRKMNIENGLRYAIENGELILFYQPQVDFNSNKIIGVESLIRWIHPEYGFISPEEFIPVAEDTGLIVTIGQWVLNTACKQFKKWQQLGLQSIAVNVSAIQFRDKNFIKTVDQVLQNSKIEPSCLELEITESATQQVEEATLIMRELKALGVQLSIDDFGTGYSSLNYLRHFPIDKLKIDKSFVDEINNHLNGEAIVTTIIQLGNSLGVKVIAEGVENEEQISFLKENNCQLGQGYFFSKPLPAVEIENLLKKQISLF